VRLLDTAEQLTLVSAPASAANVGRYLGKGPDEGLSEAALHSSGQEHYGGHIPKHGRRDLRRTMVDVAWVAVANHAYWKALFDRLADRLGRHKAIVAIVRPCLRRLLGSSSSGPGRSAEPTDAAWQQWHLYADNSCGSTSATP
jgi:Transposase IS116/IS110/IS902 family